MFRSGARLPVLSPKLVIYIQMSHTDSIFMLSCIWNHKNVDFQVCRQTGRLLLSVSW